MEAVSNHFQAIKYIQIGHSLSSNHPDAMLVVHGRQTQVFSVRFSSQEIGHITERLGINNAWKKRDKGQTNVSSNHDSVN